MEWITAVRKSVKFIEEHLKDKISAQDVSCCTGFVKGFSYDTANDEIPKYWDEICKNMQPMFMQEMRRQMNMKKLWWKTASENMVSALMMKN